MSDDNHHPDQPDGTLSYILRELVEVKADMASMRAVVDAQGEMINTLFLSLPVSQRPAALALLHAQQMTLESDGETSAAAMLGAFMKGLQGLLGEEFERSMGEVTVALDLGNALVQSVPAEQAQAMRTWLSIATEGEIAQDAEQLPPQQLAALLRLQSASKSADRADDANGTKGPD